MLEHTAKDDSEDAPLKHAYNVCIFRSDGLRLYDGPSGESMSDKSPISRGLEVFWFAAVGEADSMHDAPAQCASGFRCWNFVFVALILHAILAACVWVGCTSHTPSLLSCRWFRCHPRSQEIGETGRGSCHRCRCLAPRCEWHLLERCGRSVPVFWL